MWEKMLEIFDWYLRRRNYSPRTIEGYLLDTRCFLSFLAGSGIRDIAGITRDAVKEYQNHLFYFRRGDKPLTLSTQDKKIHAVMAFCRFLARENYLPYDPAHTIERPRIPKRLPGGIVSPREMTRLLEAPDRTTLLGMRDKAILELLYSTGMRNTELCCSRLRDLDMKGGSLRISFAKGSKTRVVPLGDVAAHFLSLYLRDARPHLVRGSEEERIFVTNRGSMLSRRCVYDLVRKYAKKAKLRTKISCHTLRHTCATHMLRNKADLRSIQELLGHGSLSTTQIYTRVELTDLKRVHAQCHPRNKR